MYVLGITGSTAMGKTTLAKMFEENGIPAFFADEAVHTLFETRKRLRQTLSKEFPGTVKKGAVDRKALGKAVFGKPAKLARLEQIVHPYVLRELTKFLKNNRQKKIPMVVLDIPLLFEIRAEDICDGVLVATTDAKTQKKRALKRPNYSEANLQARLDRQMADAEKRRRADFVIDTSGAKKQTRKQVEKLIAKLKPKGHY